jgi:hypothetical protein
MKNEMNGFVFVTVCVLDIFAILLTLFKVYEIAIITLGVVAIICLIEQKIRFRKLDKWWRDRTR